MIASDPLPAADEAYDEPPGGAALVVAVNKLIFAATCIILVVVPFVSGTEHVVIRLTSMVPFFLLYGYCWYTAVNGNGKRGAVGFLVGTWFFQILVVTATHDMDGQALVSCVNLVLASGFMLGRRASVWTSAVCILSMFVIYGLRDLGIMLEPVLPPTPPSIGIMALGATLLGTGGLTFIGIRHMTNSIRALENSRSAMKTTMDALERALLLDTRRSWCQERLGVMARALVGLRQPAEITHEVTVGIRDALEVQVAFTLTRGGRVESLVGVGDMDCPSVLLADQWEQLVESGDCRLLPAPVVQDLSERLGIPAPEAGLIARDARRDIILVVLGASEVLDGKHAVWSLQVVTNLLSAAIDRLLSERQLLQTDKMDAIGHLSAGIAHDFNNLLTTVLGGAEIVSQKLGPAHPLRIHIQGIREAGERAAALTSKLMSFTRATSRSPVPVAVVGLLEDLMPMLRRSVEESIQIEAHLEEEALWVAADPIDLERIVLNLVVNARDALGPSGRIDIGVESRPGTQGEGEESQDCVVVWVQDDGEGMDVGVRSRVFEPFFTTRKNKGSTGLGLSIVYGVVEGLGGEVYVDSIPGEGTCFEVILPRLVNPVLPEPPSPLPVPSMGGERVMVVEDDPDVRATVSEMLQLGGFQVLQVGSGSEALDLLACEEAVDLVLSDVVMPGMSGFELAGQMVDRGITVPLALISGYAAGKSVETPGDSTLPFISKPFSLGQLLEFVQQQVR